MKKSIAPDLEHEVMARVEAGETSDHIAAWLVRERGVKTTGRGVRRLVVRKRQEQAELAKTVIRDELRRALEANQAEPAAARRPVGIIEARFNRAVGAPAAERGSVYVIQGRHDPSGPVKIGFTSRAVRSRLSTLQCAAPYDLHVLVAISGSRSLERSLHRRFASSRLNREWFKWTEEVQAWVELQIHAGWVL